MATTCSIPYSNASSRVEGDGSAFTPVDYKHGRPRETDDGLQLWPADRVQLAIQGLVLRENGYICDEGIVYYAAPRQRVRVEFDEALVRETEETIRRERALAADGNIPEPLADSPKCPGCSLVGICLPDETNSLTAARDEAPVQLALFGGLDEGARKPVSREVRQLLAPRQDRRLLFLNSQGMRVGKSGEVLQVRDKDQLVRRTFSCGGSSSGWPIRSGSRGHSHAGWWRARSGISA